MDLFVAHIANRVDAKGRVSIPASFRAVLTRDGFEGLFVTPSLDAEALDCGGNALLREIAELIARQPPYSPERDLFLDRALRAQRDAEGGRRGPHGPLAHDQGPRAHHRRGDVRGTGAEVPDLGTEPLPRASRRGHASPAQPAEPARHPGRGEWDIAHAAASWSTGMNAGGGDLHPQDAGAAGGPARHVPVLREEVFSALGVRDGGLYLDGNLRCRRLHLCDPRKTRHPRARARPRPTAVAGGSSLVDKFGDRLTLVEARFADLESVAGRLGLGPFDGVAPRPSRSRVWCRSAACIHARPPRASGCSGLCTSEGLVVPSHGAGSRASECQSKPG